MNNSILRFLGWEGTGQRSQSLSSQRQVALDNRRSTFSPLSRATDTLLWVWSPELLVDFLPEVYIPPVLRDIHVLS